MALTINEGIIVKAYLDSQEIRRFLLDSTVCTNFEYLYQKTRHIFQFPAHQELRFSWKDDDGDLINFSSNEELIEALNQIKDNVFRIYVTRRSQSNNCVMHENVVCDGCQQQLCGTRYKCTVCPDYDLCCRCEFDGKHNEHDMMCVRRPIPPGDWVFWHNFANVSSQQRGIDYQMEPNRDSPRQGWPSRCRNKLWKKAWKCHQRLQRESSRENVQAASPNAANVTDVQPPMPCDVKNTQLRLADQREFLKSMSEAVQSMLNPFGIDVAFSLPDDLKEGCEKPIEESDSTKAPEEVKKPAPSPAPEKNVERPQAMNVDLDANPATPDPQRTAEFIVIDPDDEETTPRPTPAPKVAMALDQMKRMGFNDTGGWLTGLLSEHDGNIDRVLDEIQRKCHQP